MLIELPDLQITNTECLYKNHYAVCPFPSFYQYASGRCFLLEKLEACRAYV